MMGAVRPWQRGAGEPGWQRGTWPGVDIGGGSDRRAMLTGAGLQDGGSGRSTMVDLKGRRWCRCGSGGFGSGGEEKIVRRSNEGEF